MIGMSCVQVNFTDMLKLSVLCSGFGKGLITAGRFSKESCQISSSFIIMELILNSLWDLNCENQ